MQINIDLTAVSLTEFITPISESFVTDINAPCDQKLFDITKAKCKSMVKPHNMT